MCNEKFPTEPPPPTTTTSTTTTTTAAVANKAITTPKTPKDPQVIVNFVKSSAVQNFWNVKLIYLVVFALYFVT